MFFEKKMFIKKNGKIVKNSNVIAKTTKNGILIEGIENGKRFRKIMKNKRKTKTKRKTKRKL